MFLSHPHVIAVCACFPHAGGDVSTCYGFDREVVGFSPRRWGCFRVLYHAHRSKAVFPTQVGMFLDDFSLVNSMLMFSPRRWGCFLERSESFVYLNVFPTQVGMFP